MDILPAKRQKKPSYLFIKKGLKSLITAIRILNNLNKNSNFFYCSDQLFKNHSA